MASWGRAMPSWDVAFKWSVLAALLGQWIFSFYTLRRQDDADHRIDRLEEGSQ